MQAQLQRWAQSKQVLSDSCNCTSSPCFPAAVTAACIACHCITTTLPTNLVAQAAAAASTTPTLFARSQRSLNALPFVSFSQESTPYYKVTSSLQSVTAAQCLKPVTAVLKTLSVRTCAVLPQRPGHCWLHPAGVNTFFGRAAALIGATNNVANIQKVSVLANDHTACYIAPLTILLCHGTCQTSPAPSIACLPSAVC
eukprot:GHRR01000739.1.p1 GENE.GHRR01000739.1~~GHRR01000739.1.p1  ORF type:complete len:198 (+),score=32.92 GHRR01000739.1:1442-2035(+)